MANPVVFGASAILVVMPALVIPGSSSETERAFRTWKKAEQEVLSQLQGEWRLVRNTINDAEKPQHVDYYRFSFADQKYRAEWKALPEHGGEVRSSGNRFVINPSKSPAEITFYGENSLLQAIFKLEKGKLTVAFFGISELDRPRGFTLRENPDRISPLIVWTFEKKEDD